MSCHILVACLSFARAVSSSARLSSSWEKGLMGTAVHQRLPNFKVPHTANEKQGTRNSDGLNLYLRPRPEIFSHVSKTSTREYIQPIVPHTLRVERKYPHGKCHARWLGHFQWSQSRSEGIRDSRGASSEKSSPSILS